MQLVLMKQLTGCRLNLKHSVSWQPVDVYENAFWLPQRKPPRKPLSPEIAVLNYLVLIHVAAGGFEPLTIFAVLLVMSQASTPSCSTPRRIV